MKLDTKFIITDAFDWECNVLNQELLIEVILLFDGGFIGYHKETKQCLLFKSLKLENLTEVQIDFIKYSVDPAYFKEKKELSVYETNVNFNNYVCKIDFWIENYDSQRQESIFYQGDIINCTVNGKTFNAKATGEIRVQLDEIDGTGNEEGFTTYKNSNATDEFLRRGYTDKDISELEFDNNNWFTNDICENDEWQENDEIEGRFDDCIEKLINFLNGEMNNKEMNNKELNNLVLSQEDKDYINHNLNFIISQCQSIKEDFNDSSAHFADMVAALPNTEMFYNKMSEFLKIWYDIKKETYEKEYIKLNNQWLRENSEIYYIDLNDLNKLPVKTLCIEPVINIQGIKYYVDYKSANKARIDKQIELLKHEIDKLNAQR